MSALCRGCVRTRFSKHADTRIKVWMPFFYGIGTQMDDFLEASEPTGSLRSVIVCR
jgi:hypothetical protein